MDSNGRMDAKSKEMRKSDCAERSQLAPRLCRIEAGTVLLVRRSYTWAIMLRERVCALFEEFKLAADTASLSR